MELRHLRYFTAAAEELNISKASRRLHVSQPAMSRIIHDLEGELGITLFVRERFGLSLTPAGEKLLVYARQILDLSSEALRVVSNQPDLLQPINIGFIATSISSFLGASLKTFREKHQGVAVSIHELSPAEQIKALRKRQIDLALVGNPCEAVQNEFATSVLFEMQLMAVIPVAHRMAGRKRISLMALKGDEFIGYNENSFPGRNQTIINACRVARFAPTISNQADSLVEVLAMIGAGSGVCLMPSDVESLPHTGVVFISIREKLEPIRFTAAWRRDDSRPIISELANHFKRS